MSTTAGSTATGVVQPPVQQASAFANGETPPTMKEAHKKTSVVESGLKTAWIAGQVAIAVLGVYILLTRFTFQLWRPINRWIYRVFWLIVIGTYSVSLGQTLGGSIPGFFALLPNDTFQYLLLATVWSFSRLHAFKVFPFTLYALMHTIDQTTMRATKTGKTRAKIQSLADDYAFSVGRAVGIFNFLLIFQLAFDVITIRPAAVISLFFYLVFYHIRLLYSPLDQDTLQFIWKWVDKHMENEKVPEKVRYFWGRIKQRVANFESLGKQNEGGNNEAKLAAIRKANAPK